MGKLLECRVLSRVMSVCGLGRGKVQQVQRRGIERTSDTGRSHDAAHRRPKAGIFVVIYDATVWVANRAQIRVLR